MALPQSWHGLCYLTLARQALVCIILVACLVWVLWWLDPEQDDDKYVDKLVQQRIRSRFFRLDAHARSGPEFLYQAIPFIVVTLLSFGVIELRKLSHIATAKARLEASSGKAGPTAAPLRGARPSIVTYPLCVWKWNPIGPVLSSLEVVGTLGLLGLVSYAFGRTIFAEFRRLRVAQDNERLLMLMHLDNVSWSMGRAAIIPFCLLWIPVSRGSPLLRLINLPFEHAVKYHRWLATLALLMVAVHSIGFMAYFVAIGQPLQILQWKSKGEGHSFLSGLVAFIAGSAMAITSLPCIRRRWYELFFGVHHLYLVFFVFWLYHVPWTVHFVVIPVLLFMLDRFLRFIQSTHEVDVTSASVLGSGSIQFNLAAQSNQGLELHALSTWFVRFPGLQKFWSFEWHAFSAAAASARGRQQELSFIAKPRGGWTACLQEQVMATCGGRIDCGTGKTRCPFDYKARVEGPYGDHSDFHFKYPSLVLVGGGIGVTPFLAILDDIAQRSLATDLDGKLQEIPSTIDLYYCVRKPKELLVLNSLNKTFTLSAPANSSTPQIRIHAYVTSNLPTDYDSVTPTTPSLCDRQLHEVEENDTALDLASYIRDPTGTGICNAIATETSSNEKQVSPILGVSSSSLGGAPWVAATFLTTISGFYVVWGLSNVLIVKSYDSDLSNFSLVNLILASMVLAIVLFGGAVVGAWWLWLQRYTREPSVKVTKNEAAAEVDRESQIQTVGRVSWNGTVRFRSRPCWDDIFAGLGRRHAGEDVGVLVSGPASMQEDVARQCRKRTHLIHRTSSSPAFHYHPISFDL